MDLAAAATAKMNTGFVLLFYVNDKTTTMVATTTKIKKLRKKKSPRFKKTGKLEYAPNTKKK